MTDHPEPRETRPTQAIDARRRDAAAKLAAVGKAVKAIGRDGTPVNRADVARLSGVSRSFTYQNHDANVLITDAQTRTQTRPVGSLQAVTAQQEASWRERALNAEDRGRQLNHDLVQQRQLVADLLGQLRDPDGTWLEDDRTRLREDNQRLLRERNQLLTDQRDLQRRLDGARATVARLNSDRIDQLFPAGPGPHKAS